MNTIHISAETMAFIEKPNGQPKLFKQKGTMLTHIAYIQMRSGQGGADLDHTKSNQTDLKEPDDPYEATTGAAAAVAGAVAGAAVAAAAAVAATATSGW